MGNSKTIINKKIKSVALNKSGVNKDEKVQVTDVTLPDDAPARMKTLKCEGKKWYLTVVYHPNTEDPFALFCHTNAKEKTVQTSNVLDKLIGLAKEKGILEEHINNTLSKISNENNISKITRSISLLLEHKVAIRNIVNTIETVDNIYVGSFLFQIKKFLSYYIQDGEIVDTEKCSNCGGTLVFSEGCMMCRDCGNSKCG